MYDPPEISLLFHKIQFSDDNENDQYVLLLANVTNYNAVTGYLAISHYP